MIRFRCPCGMLLKAKDEQGGRKLKCPSCDEIVEVPRPGAVAGGLGEQPGRGEEELGGDQEGRSHRRAGRRAAREGEQDRPRRHKMNAGKGRIALLVGVIVAGVLLVVGGVVLIVLLSSSKEPTTVARQKAPKPNKVQIQGYRTGLPSVIVRQLNLNPDQVEKLAQLHKDFETRNKAALEQLRKEFARAMAEAEAAQQQWNEAATSRPSAVNLNDPARLNRNRASADRKRASLKLREFTEPYYDQVETVLNESQRSTFQAWRAETHRLYYPSQGNKAKSAAGRQGGQERP